MDIHNNNNVNQNEEFEGDEQEQEQEQENYGPGEEEEIEPEDVDMNDYEYHFLNNEITKIKNKDDLSYVEFKIIEENKKEKVIIKEEIKNIYKEKALLK